MRDFKATAEPRGSKRGRPSPDGATALPFVVQKHAATRLHYDFRLGWNGVLKSWAVTKGPSYFPGDKRLAVQVEDHPLEYGSFEGTIPKGQYGGGAVMVWDTGTWEPLDDVDRGLNDGRMKFELHGTKLKGRWALVRMHGRAGGEPDKPNWLLIKEKDAYAREDSDTPITEEAPDSATTGRTIEEIASDNGRVWNSARGNGRADRKPSDKERSTRTAANAETPKEHAGSIADLSSLPRERFPGFITPQLAQQTAAPPSGSDWQHELKLDGYRIQIHILPGNDRRSNPRAKLLTRKGLDWTSRMPDIANAAARLHVTSAILDGEAVALDERGVSDFAALQAAFHEKRQRYIVYFAFDILHLDGHNLRNLPLLERREILAGLLRGRDEGTPLRLSESLEADGKIVFKKACALGAEGIVSKLATAKYTSGRGSSWLKVKCRQEQEFVIGGFTLPSKGDAGIGALLLGYYDRGKLRYAGRSGTGFTQKIHRTIRSQLEELKQKDSPFADVPREVRRTAHWVKPQLVAQIVFSTWTRDHLVRQAAFKGLREDKRATEVVRETAAAPAAAARSASAEQGSTRRPKRNRKEVKPMMGLAITHPDKVLDQESGMTKQDLAEYYAAVAEHLLPHISNRPLSVVRCPDGNSKPCFFQKHVGLGLPAGVNSVSIRSPKSGKKEDYLTVDSSQGLVGLAQMGVLEIHPWGSKNDSLERPDRIVFDLDPDAAIDWATLGQTARDLQGRLKKLGLESFLKSTGGKGLHVVVPIEPEHDWPVIKDFAHRLVLDMEKDKPDLYVTKMTKASRKNRIYLDYLRNDRESTSVAPYSPRARQGTPVAVPLRWNELDAARPPAFHVADLGQWRARLRRDPWARFDAVKQSLGEKALRATSALSA